MKKPLIYQPFIAAGWLLAAPAAYAGTVCDASQCTITVDWALDPNPTSSYETCDYTQGAIFKPAVDGKCTWRRAIKEAGARSHADDGKTINIRFDGLSVNGDADDGQYNSDGQWILAVSGSTPIQLQSPTITDITGPVSIKGTAFDPIAGEKANIVLASRPTLEIRLTDVSVENLGFNGGGGIYFYESGGVFKNNIWGLSADGQSVVYEQPVANGWNKLAGKMAVLMHSDADDYMIENNVISGAYSRAIFINGGTSNGLIQNNRIGLRLDGTLPAIPDSVLCRTFSTSEYVNPDLDANEWLGGWGISLGGTGATVSNNLLAGLQNIRTANETPPMALEIFGAEHTVSDNIIGRDINGNTVGVCGQAIKYSAQTDALDPSYNPGHTIVDNIIDRSRNLNPDEPTDSAILWGESSPSTVMDGGNTVRRNLVFDSTTYYHRFSQNVSQAKKIFEPAEITSISGTTVTGGNDSADINGDPSPCPNCIIDFYLDNNDAKQEALQYLGTATANAAGDFTFTLASPLPAGHGIRTMSIATANGVIGNSFAGTTSTMSRVVYGAAAPDGVLLQDSFEDE